ncbi:MAG: 5'-nucleotidase [Ferruginibacter sp.]
MRKILLSSFVFSLLLLQFSCSTTYQAGAVQYKDYRIKQGAATNADITNLLKPYSDSVNRNMNDVIAVAGMPLEKKQPEGTLGNVLADAMLAMAKEKYNTNVDAAFINFGGIRLPSIPAGNITRGKIFELSPFDNIIVLLKVNGKTLKQFLDLVAGRGGWPCAGIRYQLKDKQAVNIAVGGNAITDDGMYTITVVDYIANGGDDCVMLKTVPQQNNGYLFRDGVLEYFSRLNKEGKKITSSIENRVSNAN